MSAAAFGSTGSGQALPGEVPPKHGFEEVPARRVAVRGGFWGPRVETAEKVTAPHALDCLEADGHVTNFDKAASGTGEPSGHHAFDSDLYKALEGVMYCLEQKADPALAKRADGILARILPAQQPDGYLITCFILRDQDKRWRDLRLTHQLYNAGHFFEMAVEHYLLTGKRNVLDAACRFADNIDRTFGEGKRYDVPGHEEIELALVKLYRATGERRYLDLTKFFLDERGYAHGTERKPFDANTAVQQPIPDGLTGQDKVRELRRARNRVRNGRMQDHKPLIEQNAIGHAVRAGYVYSAMADVARFMDAPKYAEAVERIWRDAVERKMYVTGGIGTAQYHDEGFGDPYLLPNKSAYCESCAAIANVLWQHRMGLLTGEAKYADVMELALYNGTLAGISLSGDHFFYQNPLTSNGGRQRRNWIGLSCCPTNLARIIPEVGGLAYARADGRVLVNLYVAGKARVELDARRSVTLTQQTNYPWDGKVKLTVQSAEPTEFDLCPRIPGWARGRCVPGGLYRFVDANGAGGPSASGVSLKINGKPAGAAPAKDGYVHISRRWRAGDVVELDLPMCVRRVLADDRVEADRGRVALMRGPIVYCIEAADHPAADVLKLALPDDAKLSAEHRTDLLGGVTVIRGRAVGADGSGVDMTAVPYYAWANRTKGSMTVWIHRASASD